MRKKKDYLAFYNKHAELGIIPGGLCHCLGKRAIKKFTPTREEYNLPASGGEVKQYYWAKTGDYRFTGKLTMSNSFTPLRQNIVLFLAAMNNQL